MSQGRYYIIKLITGELYHSQIVSEFLWFPLATNSRAQNMNDANEYKQKVKRVDFLNQEAAGVYLLLDFLSGRADRSLGPTPDKQLRSRSTGQPPAPQPEPGGTPNPEEQKAPMDHEAACRQIEEDLEDPTRLLHRVMAIKYPIEEQDAHFAANAAFLMRARDVLNTRAAPATGATIAFTAMVTPSGSSPGREQGITGTARELAREAYPLLESPAERLGRWVRRQFYWMAWVLVVTVALSAYIAWGKSFLDSLDAVRHDDSATQQALYGRISTFTKADNGAHAAAVECIEPTSVYVDNNVTTDVNDACYRLRQIKIRNDVTYANLAAWRMAAPFVKRPGKADETLASWQTNTGQRAIAEMTIVGNYVMPILYGYLGSTAFILRRYYNRFAAHLLSPRDLTANRIRWLLGLLIGGCVGLVYSGSGTAQSTGTLGLAVTLSTSAIAFLAGYGVEVVFKALDALISDVFHVNGTEKTPKQTTAN